MLAALQAHSRSLLGIDGPEEAESSTQAQRRLSRSSSDEDGDDLDGDGDGDDDDEAEFQSDDGWGAEDDFVSDSEDGLEDITKPISQKEKEKEVVVKSAERSKVPEVVFAPQTSNSSDVLSKAERRAFLVCSIYPQCHTIA